METALLVALGLVVGLAIAGLAVFVGRQRAPATDPMAAQLADQRIAELGARVQGMGEHVQAMGELLGNAQVQFQTAVNERLDAVTQNLGTSMLTSTKHTVDHLQKLNERLAVIDSAQKNLTELTSQVTSLRDVLSNKQARGAFGQSRMEAIIQDSLPKGAYEFQHTLRNGKRPDCVVLLPDQRPLVIDAKFPLEAFTAFRDSRTDDERKFASQRVRQDVMKHVNDIAERYLVPGETQDVALMFVPSESIYAELHDGFDDVVQKAYRAQIMMVSPTLLMLAIQVIQQIQKDARMREAADQIRAEVGHLMDDLGRLGDRVRKLQTHFGQANEDIRQAIISMEKIERRGERIRHVEFGGEEPPADNVIPAPMPPARRVQAGEF
jgi:DNA recombination protein RmuC